ncbi:alpha/beta fold hydrolase [Spiribacter halobius]|uniref:Alpha/beta hydrolase n=1 Tax=Sediminicurvatus halobius TaxID=2182432 RepID=A0A2U2MYY6_9GAMM|nr:alpha/beta fold hydrolase [Spiribacter halobius]PWG62201.1 alpha/beta hydrolase [Spiribacter halobius]UEX78107.1 alpha/beta fold hydrolase [Spiribacter halobius]
MTQTVELACTETGSGPPLVFLHGLYGSGNNWRSQARALADRYRVLLPDLRNHGRSPHVADMDYRAMAADVDALLAREGVERAAVVGHSMGGKTAMALALTRPQRLAALVVVDIAPVAYHHDHGEIISALHRVDLNALTRREDADTALARDIPEPLVRQFLLTNLQRQAGGWSWRIPLDLLAGQIPVIEGWPALDGRWEGPAAFIHGGASDYVDSDGAAAIHRYFPAAALQAMPGIGHWVHAEAPEDFMARLRRFLDAEYSAS